MNDSRVIQTLVMSMLFSASLFADDAFVAPEDITYRQADIISEGTRMSAEVLAPKKATHKLPTIVMSHGWGGTAEHLRPDAVAFAQAGFLVVAFDYRGWGKSDARVITMSRPVRRDGNLIAEVTEVRGVVDPIDQTTDILNALHWVQGEELCDPNRLGIWGSSFSGGHVVYVAARDPRVKAFVSQVGSMDARWVIQNRELRTLTFEQGTRRTRGGITYPEPFARFGGLNGQPVWEKLMRYAPIEDIERCVDCAKLFIIAENEELFDNKDHAIAAYNRAEGVKKLVTVKDIKHYGIYTEKRKEAQQLAINWFREHLKADGKDKDSLGDSQSRNLRRKPTSAEDEWKRLPDMPVEKWESGTVMVDDKLYLFGGYSKGVRSSKRCDVFDPRDHSWKRIQDLPSAISHMNTVLDGRTVWFAGGFKDGYKGHTIAEVWKYDIDEDRYTAAPLLPETRGGGGLALVGQKLHYLGGVKADRDTDAADHWVLDLKDWTGGVGSARWENAAPLPAPRNQFSTVTLDGKIYVIGGQLHHDSQQLDQARVDIYDPKTDIWSRGPNLPKGHSHSEGGTFVSKGRIIMVGGHTTPTGGRKQIDPDILALTPGGQWEVVAKLPMPLSSPAAAIISGKLYVAGGSPDGGSVQAKMWVRDAP